MSTNAPDFRNHYGYYYIQYDKNGKVKIHPVHGRPYVTKDPPSERLRKKFSAFNTNAPDTRPFKQCEDMASYINYFHDGKLNIGNDLGIAVYGTSLK